MKTLSIQQPWAFMVVAGIKSIELRSKVFYPQGELLIHASKKVNKEAYRILTEKLGHKLPPLSDLTTGAIIGKVGHFNTKRYMGLDFVADEERHCCPPRYFVSSPYGLIFTNPVAFEEPISFKGRLGIFHVPDELLKGVDSARR